MVTAVPSASYCAMNVGCNWAGSQCRPSSSPGRCRPSCYRARFLPGVLHVQEPQRTEPVFAPLGHEASRAGGDAQDQPAAAGILNLPLSLGQVPADLMGPLG